MISRWKRRALIAVLAAMLVVPTLRAGAWWDYWGDGSGGDYSTSALPRR
jgi:hypothetical protein